MSPKMSLRYLFSIDYLFSTTGKLSYGLLYLLFFLAATVAGITYRILAKRKNDYIAKEDFVKQFFWIYVLWGALGLVSVFARAQNLPVFGARIFTINHFPFCHFKFLAGYLPPEMDEEGNL